MVQLSFLAALLTATAAFAGYGQAQESRTLRVRTDNGLQDLVTWDEHSLLVKGKRVLILSGEMHPWRIPVPSLWIDVFEKIKALGFNTVSFYVHWGLVEYAKDDFNFDGYLSLEPFFEAAKKTGMYLIARPGPYINSETTGGGTPGWGTRVPGAWRTNNQTYFDAMEGYVRQISKILAPAQITNGGPLILVQPENEYSYCFEIPNCPVPWPQPEYMQLLQDLMREEGLIVPTITNEVQFTSANYEPGSGLGEVDIRGYDNYPLSFICNAPSNWPDGKLPTNFWEVNHELSPGNPNSILEMQSGAHGRWGWFSTEDCGALTGTFFQRVFYKNYVSFSTKIWNLYMMYGGTNWGGIASPATITSYDYGSPIRENRLLTREKYSDLKLISQFLRVSPAYLTTRPLNQWPVNTVNGSFTTNPSLGVTQLADVVGNKTVFWIVRHAAYNSWEKSNYKLQVPTSLGAFSIPTLQGTLVLNGRDSKIHVTDYDIGGNLKVLYSSGEIFTWKKFTSKTVVVIYGEIDEVHETAFLLPGGTSSQIKVVEGDALQQSSTKSGVVTLNYKITSEQTVISVGSQLQVVIVNRHTAYDLWVPNDLAIVKSPYLIRSAEVGKSGVLALRGDLNQTRADAEVFADNSVRAVTFNGKSVSVRKTEYGSLKFELRTQDLRVTLPSLANLNWKYIDGLPEVQSGYDDSKWTKADILNTTNPRKPKTPTSLYSSDYGYHTGNILWRGHFTANGKEKNLTVEVQGGGAFSASLYFDNKQIASYAGKYGIASVNLTAEVPELKPGSKHVITVLQDHMGLEQNYGPGGDLHKIPRGILNYSFNGEKASATDVSWKVTGNLGGEYPADRVRGPLNEGGLYPERQGFHQPGVDTKAWKQGSPLEGFQEPGVRFYSTTFKLNIPTGLDVPLSFNVVNNTIPLSYRAQIYVNGYQFGKYASNLGPQTSFPVPEGIINHRGENTLAVSVWGIGPTSSTSTGFKFEGFELRADGIVSTSLEKVVQVGQPKWKLRKGAY